MQNRTSPAALFVSILLFPLAVGAVNVTVTDGCARLDATGATTSVDASGNLTVNATVPPYGVVFCDPSPPPQPVCVLSASQTKIASGTVRLFAKCSPAATTYSWVFPSGAAAPTPVSGQSGAFTVTLTNAGAYSYAVTGTNANGAGPISTQLTILVGDSSKKPTCILTASPFSIIQGSNARLLATCNGEPSSYTWTADAGAPTASGSGADLNFPSPGTFTYKVQGTNGAGMGPMASATVSVAGGVVAAKAFSPATVGTNLSSIMTITLTNGSAIAATGVSFTDTYPSGLVNTAAANGATTCGGTHTAANGGTSVALSGGTVPASGSCTVTVNVTSATANPYVNSTGAITTSNMGTSIAASGTLRVMARPTVAMSLNPTTINAGTASVLTITLSNSNTLAITGAAFTNSYPAGLVNTSSASPATTCGGTATAANNGTSVALSGGSIPASGSCTVTVNVTSNAGGTYTDTLAAGAVTTTNAGSNTAAASASLTVSVCNSSAVNYDYGLISPNATTYNFAPLVTNQTVAVGVVLGGGANTALTYLQDTYNELLPDGAQLSISQCKGDFTATATCAWTLYNFPNYQFYLNTPGTYGDCTIQPGIIYYVNMKVTCSTSSGGCGFRWMRGN